MEKEFVPYELALRMKILGFDEPCLAGYNKELLTDDGRVLNNIFIMYGGSVNYNIGDEVISAPLKSQAFRWFREKYNIHVEITWSPSYEYDPGVWSDAIYEITFVDVSYTKEWKAESPDMQRMNGKQLTYEEAELATLEKLIEIVESKKE